MSAPPRRPYLQPPRYPISAAHVRRQESLDAWSLRSDNPYMIITWLADFLDQLGYEVLFDHDYSEENDAIRDKPGD